MLNRLSEKSNNDYINELITVAKNDGDITKIKNILDKGVDVNQTNEKGWYPLSIASCNGYPNIVKLLLAAGANPNVQEVNDCSTPLLDASSRGHVEIVKLLLEAGADPTKYNDEGRTPLHQAASRGYMDLAKVLLLHQKVDVNKKDLRGWTPLCIAANYGKPDEVTLFLNAGADPNVKANDGQTPLHIASSMGHPDAIKLLLEAGADPYAKTNDGRTPLKAAHPVFETLVADAFKKFEIQKLHVLFLQGIELIRKGLPIDIFIEIISFVINRSHKDTQILFEKHQRQVPLKLFDVSMKHIKEKSPVMTEKEAQDAIYEANLKLQNRMILR